MAQKRPRGTASKLERINITIDGELLAKGKARAVISSLATDGEHPQSLSAYICWLIEKDLKERRIRQPTIRK